MLLAANCAALSSCSSRRARPDAATAPNPIANLGTSFAAAPTQADTTHPISPAPKGMNGMYQNALLWWACCQACTRAITSHVTSAKKDQPVAATMAYLSRGLP